MTGDPGLIEAPARLSTSRPARRRRFLRVLFWAAAGLVGLWVVAFALATWDRDRAAAGLRKRGMPATYEEAVAAMQAKAGTETGVELLRQALRENERLGHLGDRYMRSFGNISLTPDEKQRAAIDDSCQRTHSVVALIEEATRRAPGPFTPRDATAEMFVCRTDEDVQQLRSLARLMCLHVNSASLRGEHDEVVRTLALSYRLAEQLAAEEFLLPQLVRIAILGVANAYTHTVLPKLVLNEKRFRALDELLGSIEAGLRFAPALRNERAETATHFETPAQLREDMRAGGNLPTPAFRTWRQSAQAFLHEQWASLICTPFGLPARRRAAARCLEIPDDVLALVDTPPPWPKDAFAKYEAWKSALNWYSLLLEVPDSTSLGVVRNAGLYAHRRLVVTRLALRVKWFARVHDRLPDRLEEVCDRAMPEIPLSWFEGRPLKYTRANESFRIEADPGEVDQAYASLLSREDIRVSWGLLVKMELSPSPPPKKGP